MLPPRISDYYAATVSVGGHKFRVVLHVPHSDRMVPVAEWHIPPDEVQRRAAQKLGAATSTREDARWAIASFEPTTPGPFFRAVPETEEERRDIAQGG